MWGLSKAIYFYLYFVVACRGKDKLSSSREEFPYIPVGIGCVEKLDFSCDTALSGAIWWGKCEYGEVHSARRGCDRCLASRLGRAVTAN